MTWIIHCDKKGCDRTRREQAPVIPDPWVTVQGEKLGIPTGSKLHFCGVEHAVEGLQEIETPR